MGIRRSTMSFPFYVVFIMNVIYAFVLLGKHKNMVLLLPQICLIHSSSGNCGSDFLLLSCRT